MGDFNILIKKVRWAGWICLLESMPWYEKIIWRILGQNLYNKTHKTIEGSDKLRKSLLPR